MLWSVPFAMVAMADARATMPRPAEILAQARRVADWQVAHRDMLIAGRPTASDPRDWQQATFWVAMTDLADRDARYRPLLLDLARQEQYRLGNRPFHADDQLIGQAWLWASRHGEGTAAIAPMRAYFDTVLANRPTNALEFLLPADGRGDPPCTTRWCWCDALFMAPATLIQLSKATGDPRYARFAHEEYAATRSYLFDRDEHLFFRDSRFFDRRDAAGRKLFWSRGNGWVFAGLVRIIAALDKGDPERAAYVALFREMAARLLPLQRANGYWAPSLLDNGPDALPETSGTGFFTYGLARGIEMGLLDRKTYLPAALKGWAALGGSIQPDGMLGWVQQVSDRPDKVAQGDTQFYGAGAFVLAATALYDLAHRR